MTYDYSFELTGGFVEFNIDSSMNNALISGDEITISGRAKWAYNLRSIWVDFECPVLPSSEDRSICTAIISVNIASGKTGSFTAKCNVYASDAMLGAMKSRTANVYITCGVGGRNGNAETVENSMGSYTTTLLKYALTPNISSASFERTNTSGTAANDGKYVTCRGLKLSLNSQASVSDITKATVAVTAEGGSAPLKTVTLTTAQLNAMLSSSGYQETTPSLLSGVEFDLGKEYYIDITIGDDYDQATYRYTVNRSFCLVDFARKQNGGFAVGMYSNSTDDKPLFEVAENHESRLYGGVSTFGGGEKCLGTQQALGIQCGYEMLTVAASSTKSASITFPKPFGAKPIVVASLRPDGAGGANYGSISVVVHGTTITTTGCEITVTNNHNGSHSLGFSWIAVGQMPT